MKSNGKATAGSHIEVKRFISADALFLFEDAELVVTIMSVVGVSIDKSFIGAGSEEV